MGLVTKIIARFQTCTRADRHVIALLHFFFAFRPGRTALEQVFADALGRVTVPDEGLLQQVNAFIIHLPAGSRLEYIKVLDWSLPDLVSLWRGYQADMPPACAVRTANLCLALLEEGEVGNRALQNAIQLFARIPVPPAGSLRRPDFSWIARGAPPGVERLLDWCCAFSGDFADAFLDGFESIFTGQIADPQVRTALLPLFLRRRLERKQVSLIDDFVEKVRGLSEDPPVIANALFSVMLQLPENNLRQLASVTLRLWKDPEAGEVEMNYVRQTQKHCDGEYLFQWLYDLERRVQDAYDARQKCTDDVLAEFQRLFSCGDPLPGKLRVISKLTAARLEKTFKPEAADTLKKLLHL
jgi:hypothetical protein